MLKILLGPIIGMVDQKKAKIWFYGSSDNWGSTQPYCHVKFKNESANVPDSPFEFQEVSNFSYQKDGYLYKAYVAEIRFPKVGEEFSFCINSDRDIAPVEFKYQVKRFPKNDDIDFSFGLISCHKPRNGKFKRIDTMWNFLYEKMHEKNSRFLIQAGDQVYCDSDSDTSCINAWDKSLELLKNDTDIDRQHNQMVDFYRQVYLRGWGFAPVQKVMSSFPQYMIWDDHEITDGWGSRNENFGEMHQKVFKAAKEAYIEFQHSHNPDPLNAGGMYYAFHLGAAAFLVLDLRGERDITKKQLLSSSQWTEIEKYLESDICKESKVLFVVSSVPVVHVSRGLMSLAATASILFKDIKDDVSDQWSHDANKEKRRKLIRLLLNWAQTGGNKPVVILGGDVHVGTEVMMKKQSSEDRIFQVTSSPITNNVARVLDFFSAPFSSSFSFRLDEEGKESMDVKVKRRHRKRNFAILEVKYESGKPKVTLNMFRQGEKNPKIRELF